MASPLLTVGHGTAGREDLARLLHDAGVRWVVDIRTAPGSRRNPDVRRDRMAEWLPDHGVGYRWERRLGGFRKVTPGSPDTWWRNASFRAYAGHTRDPRFLDAIDDLLVSVRAEPTTVLCSESVWWRCHRRLVADFVTLARGVEVRHLMPDGKLTRHVPAEGARLTGEGLLVYDRS